MDDKRSSGRAKDLGDVEALMRRPRRPTRPRPRQHRERAAQSDGKKHLVFLIVLQLRHRWADGTTHLERDPLDFLGRLAVLVPRPRINLILYHGVLAVCGGSAHDVRGWS